jgi:hypothetical protein
MTPHRRQRRVLRSTVLLVSLAVMACSSDLGKLPFGSAPAAGPSPSAAASSLVQEPFTPSPLAQYLMDTATFQTRTNGKYSATIIATLPTGVAVETTYSVDPTPVSLDSLPPATVPGSPLQAFVLSPHKTTADGNFTWAYSYVIPTDGFPKDAFTAAASGDGVPGWLWHAVQAFVEPQAVLASGGQGVQATVTGGGIAISQDFVAHLEGHHVLPGAPITTGLSGLYSIYEAFNLGKEYTQGQQKIEEIRKCAENPTNPLTKANYAKDPNAKQAVLDEVAATKQNSTLNATVQFIGALNAKAASLVGKAAPWLPVLVESGTAWANSNLNDSSEERISQLERLVPKCEEQANKWIGTIKYTYSEIGPRTKEDASATITFGDSGPGTWTATRVRTENWDRQGGGCPDTRTFSSKGNGTLELSVIDFTNPNPLGGMPAMPGQASAPSASLVVSMGSHSLSIELDLTGTKHDAGGGPDCPGFKDIPEDIQTSISAAGTGPTDPSKPNVLAGSVTTTPFPGATETITWSLTGVS